jgi:hypothetical protein
MPTRGELRPIGRPTEADLKEDAGEGAPVQLQSCCMGGWCSIHTMGVGSRG